MIWQYGNYKFDCQLQPPTLNKFKIWKDKFFKLDNVSKYDVWLTGGFVEEWNTKDIDIVLNNKPIYNELQTIMSEAIKIGIDNNIFVDICHLNMKPLDYTKTKKSVEVVKTVVGNKIIQDGKMITDWTNSIEVYPNLYQFKKTYPTKKQMKRIYKYKPILLKN
tara:strand:+ start:927 stop:1415 length:489 start_codon:yes stop_codon:yes gene_type:complete